MNTGKIIVRLREQKNWNQSDLANASGVSRVMIGKYEREEAAIWLALIRVILLGYNYF